MTTPSSLEHFDFLQLLLMLAHNRKTGVMRVFRDEEQFQCWLEEGQVRRLRFVGPGTDLEGVRALTELLRRPEGRFQFEDGLLHTAPRLDRPLEAVAYEALGDLPDLPLPFTGPGRLTRPESLAHISWSLSEEQAIEKLRQQLPLSEIATTPELQRLVSRLVRLGLLTRRKVRLARLLVHVTHDVSGVALIDERILERWRKDLLRLPQVIRVRRDDGQKYSFPVWPSAGLEAELLLPPDMLMLTQIQAGESVLVKPR